MTKYLMIFALIISQKALACNKTAAKLICPGDTVVSQSGYVGTVLGINQFKHQAGVHWTISASGYGTDQTSTADIDTLAIGIGCLGSYCIDDTVTSTGGYVGQIIGVNPVSGTIAVHWSTSASGYSTDSRTVARIEDLALGRGCVKGDCVGDKVISQSGYQGTIIGINRFTGSAAVHWTTSASGYSTDSRSIARIEDLSVANYCTDYGDLLRQVPYSMRRSPAYRLARRVPGLTHDFYINQ